MDRNRLRAAIVVVVLALAGLVPACSSAQPENECKETPWRKGEVAVTRQVELRATHDDEAQVLAEIAVGETLSPTSRYRCRGERLWLQVEHDGKVGWIKRNHVTFSTPTPTLTR